MEAFTDDADLYGTLGVDRNASRVEIKKAYHKLARTHHPDKVAIEDREAAEIKFKRIGQAYDILYDEEKREIYDTHGMAAFDGSRPRGMGGGAEMEDILEQMFGMGMGGMGGMPGMGRGGPKKPRRGPDEEKPYPITLEELYTGKTQKFTATKNVICSHCKGRGGKEHAKPKQCASCKGLGAKQVLRQNGPLLMQETVTCNSCQGTGNVYNEKDKCKKCKGKKTVSERKALELYIPRGSQNGDKIILQGEADQAPDQEPGDIIFELQEKQHDVFERAGADLTASMEITLGEALCGLSRVVIQHLDGRGLHVNHKKPKGGVLRPMQVLKIPGEGMPIKKSDARGDLYLVVQVKFPEDDWLQDEKITSALKEILPKPDPPIKAELIDEVEHDDQANLDTFGGGDPGAWEDDEDEDDEHGPQCRQQ